MIDNKKCLPLVFPHIDPFGFGEEGGGKQEWQGLLCVIFWVKLIMIICLGIESGYDEGI